jgi:RNA polymerase sigma-70 factor, ECF subfamily
VKSVYTGGTKVKVFSPKSVIDIETMMDYNDTYQLIVEYLAGDHDAIEKLVKNHQVEVYQLALSILGDSQEANDAAQDAFIAAVSSLDSYQHYTSFKAWLYTITVNTCRSRLRRARAVENLKNIIQSAFRIHSQGNLSTEEQVIKNEQDAALWRALGKLKDRHRIPLILRYFNGLAISEISVILNTPEGTIHSRLHFARKQLRSEFEKETV